MSFFLYDGACFTDRAGVFTADLALSLDVIYHLTEDTVFEAYMRHLFAAGSRFVIIYATDREIPGDGTARPAPAVHFMGPDARHGLAADGSDAGPE